MAINSVSEVQTVQKDREPNDVFYLQSHPVICVTEHIRSIVALRFVLKLIGPTRPARLP